MKYTVEICPANIKGRDRIITISIKQYGYTFFLPKVLAVGNEYAKLIESYSTNQYSPVKMFEQDYN